MKVTVIPIVICSLSTVTQGGFENKRASGDRPNYSIVEMGQNTKKSPGDLRRLAVTQTPVTKLSVNAGVKKSQRSKIIIRMTVISIVMSTLEMVPK